jgi:hypothetical protein
LPPEADEFLRVKGVFSSIYDNEYIKKICKNFSNGGAHAWRAGAKSAFVSGILGALVKVSLIRLDCFL